MPKPSRTVNDGERFGRLTVLAVAVRSRRTYFSCQCDCGKEKRVRKDHLLSGKIQSCGCLSVDTVREMAMTHGKTGTVEHGIWKGMRQRVLDVRDKAYPRYGGRGIRIAPRWDSFENFLTDMGLRPSADYSLERVDNNGDYSPQNCKWILKSRQARNRRDTRMLEIDGESKSLADWADTFGLPSIRVRRRIDRGWNPLRALTTPLKKAA